MRLQTAFQTLILVILFFVTCAPAVDAGNYYLSAKGNDKNAGTSPSQAWQTLVHLNNIRFYPGDSIMLKGGDTLAGVFYVTAPDSGTDAKPVVFCSYGAGRATINAGNGVGFYGYNSGGFTIENINFYGTGTGSNTNSGIAFYTDTSNGHKFKHIYIENCDISGFGQCGILIGAYHASYPGFQDIHISGVNISNVGTKGIFIFDYAGQNSKLYGNKNLYIGHCTVMYSGVEGILVSGVDSGVVEYSRAGYTGYNTDNGDAGIWAYSSNNVTFQYDISDHATTSGSDGEGFDLDGGTQNCVIQYCYAYQNDACGFMHCDYPSSRANYNNIIRYCISENDGRKLVDDECSFLFISWGTGIDHCYMYNNTAYISDNGSHPVSAFRGYILTGYASNPFITSCMAINNIMYVRGSNRNALVSLYSPNSTLDNSNILFAGNCYFSTNSQHWINNGNSYSSLRNWQDSTGQEMLSGIRKGYLINPGLQSAGGGGAITNPDSLRYMSAYMLKPNDPIIGRGLGIDTLFALPMPATDFFGDTLKPYHVYSMGVDEPQPLKQPKAGMQVAQTCFGDSTVFTDASTGTVSWYWNFGDTNSKNTDTSSLKSTIYRYTKPGTYTVVHVVRSVFGLSDTIKKTIKIFPPALASFSMHNTCAGIPVNFTDSSTNVRTYSWRFGDNQKDTVQSPAHRYGRSGNYYVSLYVASANGCTDSMTRVITVYPKPDAQFSNTGKCQGDSFRFQDSSKNATGWVWNFGDGGSSKIQNPSHVYKQAGRDSVYLIAYSSNGCSDTISKPVSVFPVAVSIFKAHNICLGTPVNLVADSSHAQTFYLWNFGDSTAIDTGMQHAHNYAFSGSYKVVLQSITNMGCTDTFSQYVQVFPLPKPGFIYSVSKQILSAKAIDSTAVDYAWNFGDMDSISGPYKVSHSYVSTGRYDISLVVKSSQGCISKSSDSVVITNTGLYPENTYPANDIILYPNPVYDHALLYYSIIQQGPVSITIQNAEGKVLIYVLDQDLAPGRYHLELDQTVLHIAPGIYFIKIVSGGASGYSKLVKL